MNLELVVAVPTMWEMLKKVKITHIKKRTGLQRESFWIGGLVSTDFEVSSNQQFLQFHCKNEYIFLFLLFSLS